MKNFLNTFFVTLGVIFFLLIIVTGYVYVADPFEIKPLIKTFTSQRSAQTSGTAGQNGMTDKNPLLNREQEKAFEAIGIDPSALPSQITPAMEACFYEKLGAARASEIKAGAAPTATDYFIARACLQ